MRLLAAFAFLAALPAAVHSQALQCRPPQTIARPHAERPTAQEPRRLLPIGGYTLAIIWAPEGCRGRSPNLDRAFACGGGNRFGFTLHGLWPDGRGARWPQYCTAAPILPERLIRRHLCATPSAQLMQHEYAKHGTCTGLAPADYFARATALYRRLHYPNMAALATRRDLTAGDFAQAFARANRGMRADMMRLNVGRDGWLEEVWLCLDTQLGYRTCPATQGGADAARRIRVQAPMQR
jgi:ribonuclease T2